MNKNAKKYLKVGCGTIVVLWICAAAGLSYLAENPSVNSKADIEDRLRQDSAYLSRNFEHKEYMKKDSILLDVEDIYKHDYLAYNPQDSAIIANDKNLARLVRSNRHACDSITSFHRAQYPRCYGYYWSRLHHLYANARGEYNDTLCLYGEMFSTESKIKGHLNTAMDEFVSMGYKSVVFSYSTASPHRYQYSLE